MLHGPKKAKPPNHICRKGPFEYSTKQKQTSKASESLKRLPVRVSGLGLRGLGARRV